MNQNLNVLIKTSSKIIMVSLPSLLLSWIGLASYAQVPSISSPLTRPPASLTPKLPTKTTSPILTPAPSSPSTSSPDQPLQTPQNEVLIPVKRIDILGSSILTSAEIETLVWQLQNKSVTLNQLQEVADKITQIGSISLWR